MFVKKMGRNAQMRKEMCMCMCMCMPGRMIPVCCCGVPS